MSAHWRLTSDVSWAFISASGSSGAARHTPGQSVEVDVHESSMLPRRAMHRRSGWLRSSWLEVERSASCVGSGDERAGDGSPPTRCLRSRR